MKGAWVWLAALVLMYLPVARYVALDLAPPPSLRAVAAVERFLDPARPLVDSANRQVLEGALQAEGAWVVKSRIDGSMVSVGLSPDALSEAERCLERSTEAGWAWSLSFRCMAARSVVAAVPRPWYEPWWACLVPIVALALVAGWMVLDSRQRRTLLVSTMRLAGRGQLRTVPGALRQSEEGRALLLMLSSLEEKEDRLRELLLTVSRQKEELERARTALGERERLALVGTLASGIAHELGNPLASLMGILEVWDEADAETRARLRTLMENQLKRMDSLIRALLSASRPPTGEIVDMEVASAIKEAWQLVSHRKDARGVSLDMEGCDGMTIRAPRELMRAFVNLFLNSIHAMEGHGTITIRCRTEDGRAVVEVGDSGPGIPEEIRDRIFDPFFTTKDPDSGTGLGLTMVLALVEAAGGAIELMDPPSTGGAWFRLTFPLAGVDSSGDS